MGMLELIDFPSSGVGNLVMVTEPRRGLPALVTINCKQGQSSDYSMPGHPAKDWRVKTICHPPGGGELACPQQGNNSQGGRPIKDSMATLSHPPGVVEQIHA